jgi:glyoxylase-like metal-dependent hydrolase (beta-lactamase superfamily II)
MAEQDKFECVYTGDHVEIYRLSPQLYFRKASLFDRGQCNSAFIVGGHGVALVDPSQEPAIEEMQEEIQLLFNKPLRYVFLTHSHGDHALGMPVVLAQPLTIFCSHRLVDQYADQASGAALVGVRGVTKLVMDGVKIELISIEDVAHSSNDMLIRIPQERVVCAGDFVVDIPMMYFHDAHPVRWAVNLREFQDLPDQYVIPGHGDLFPFSCFKTTADYLDTLVKATDRILENDTPRTLKDIDDAEMNRIVASYLDADSPEARIIKEKAGGQAQRELRMALRNMRNRAMSLG